MQLHRHAIGNEKRPGVVDGDGNVDNERMVISSDVCYVPRAHPLSVFGANPSVGAKEIPW